MQRVEPPPAKRDRSNRSWSAIDSARIPAMMSDGPRRARHGRLMLRVVADANVPISAALARSPNAPSVLTLDAALDGRLEPITFPLLLRAPRATPWGPQCARPAGMIWSADALNLVAPADRQEVRIMITPDGSAAASPPPHPRAVNFLLGKPLTVRRAARIIASVTVFVTIISGVLIHFTDPKNFANVGAGLWWAVQTVTTVGYGDLVPTSTTGRLVATLVMLVGIGFLTVITALITSTFIETARRRIEGSGTDVLSAKLDQISARLDAIEAGLENIRRQ
jgi:voltage-gated potassium channel